MNASPNHFDPIPSWSTPPEVVAVKELTDDLLGVPVSASGQVPEGLSRQALQAAGFHGRVGQTLLWPGAGMVLYGIGDEPDAASLMDAAAAFANTVPATERLALMAPDSTAVPPDIVAQALVEGVALARYRYEPLKRQPGSPPLTVLRLGTEEGAAGAARGALFARATALARDLANTPPSIMNAEAMAACATRIAGDVGLDITVFDKDALLEMGCGGLLGVNAGSADPPRMIKLTYLPPGDAAKLTLVGKGIMYDSGGISLKPSDAVHATMKNDMSGAGAILAAMAILPALGCPTAVTAYLMCTDNMPSGSATKLGDVLTIRGGATVEVINTDAEGRLVMADALVLATEEPTDAIVDIATLTGACQRALGTQIAGVFGNEQPLVDQVLAAAGRTGESAWQLPLARRYRGELDSDIADIKNMGGPNGGAIHAALFLEEFVAGLPWAHIDIAGTAQNDAAASWRPKGCTGFGARLLADLAVTFTRPRP